MSERKYPWNDGNAYTPTELYAKGMDDERMRASNVNRASVKSVTDEIKSLILNANRKSDDGEERTPTWWPSFNRAAEHIVYNPTGAPAGAGSIKIAPEQALPATLVDTWLTSSMPVLRYTRMIESGTGEPIPALPSMATKPTAGTRTGEKQPMYTKAFDVQPAATTDVKAGLYLNISQVLADMGFMPLTQLVMKSAVLAEASKQIAVAIETAAGSGMATFTGSRFTPSVVVVPPVNLPTLNAANYAAAGMTVVIDPNVTKTLVVDPNSVIGWFRQGNMQQNEPSVYGVGVAFSAFGKVAVEPAGVAALTAP